MDEGRADSQPVHGVVTEWYLFCGKSVTAGRGMRITDRVSRRIRGLMRCDANDASIAGIGSTQVPTPAAMPFSAYGSCTGTLGAAVRGGGALRRAVVLTSGAQIVIQSIGLFTGVLVARWLGPDGRGQLAAVVSWAATLTSLGNLGLPVAFTYASAKYPKSRSELIGNGAIIVVAQWLVLGLIGWFLLPRLLVKHGPTIAHLSVDYLWAFVPLNLLTIYANAVQQGSGNYARYNAVRTCVPLAYLALLLVFWVAYGISVQLVVIANILSNLLAMVLAAGFTLRSVNRDRCYYSGPWFNLAGLQQRLRYGLSAQIGTLQPFSGLQLDVLALTVLVPSHDLGLYMAALAGANLVRAQGYALGQVVLPEIAKEGRREDQWRTIRRFMLLAAAGGGVAFIVVLFFAASLLRLVYGAPFEAAAPVLKLLVVAGTVNAVYRVVADGLRGMGKPGVSTVAEIASASAGVITLVVFVPMWGIIGAAMAVTVASLVAIGVAFVVVWWNGSSM